MQKSYVIPTLKYEDAPAAIEFLKSAFGFAEKMVVPGENGTIAHAQLVLGELMIMVGSLEASADPNYTELLTTPKAAGGVTQSPYIVIADVERHYAQARGAGAEITLPLEEQDYGGAMYSAKDPEGHLWNFGSYDPWAEPNSY